mgnify:CR=1 FL=1
MDTAAQTIRSGCSNANDAESCTVPDDEPSEPGGGQPPCIDSEEYEALALAELKRQRSGEASSWLIRAVKG